MSARQFSSKAIFEKVFILEDIESIPLNMLETHAQAQDAEERRQGEASQRESTH